jgi:hypothetical protein
MKKITLVKTKQKQQRNFKFVRLSIVYLFISSISGTSNVCRLTADCPLNSFCEPRSGGWDGQCVCQDGYFMRSSGKIRECIPIADYGELCYMNKQCEYRLGLESECKNGQCSCKDGTHYNVNENACFNSSSKSLKFIIKLQTLTFRS